MSEENKNTEPEINPIEETTPEAQTQTEQSENETVSETELLKMDLEKEKDKFLRLFAEFENFKKRSAKERLDLFKTANQEVLLALLPILDDFERALGEISKSGDENLVKGVSLIFDKLTNTLSSKGLEVVEVKSGDAFDADYAEAITQIPAPTPELKGKIVDVIEKGYKLGDKIIRYPKVVTGA